MLQDARQIADGSSLETAVCIIGGGAAGITLALEFAGTPLDVIVLESGGLSYSSSTQELARGTLTGLPYGELDYERVRQLGGCTEHWGGSCHPLRPEDFVARPWIPGSGWPITMEELVPYLRRAARVVEIEGYDAFAVPDWDTAIRRLPPLEVLRFDSGNVLPRIYQKSPPTRFGQRYRADLERATNIRVLLNANLTGFDTDEDRREIGTARVACLGGPRFAVKARSYILATGTIENARILLAAAGSDRHGFGNEHDLVGRYFHEHVAYLRVADLLPARRSGFAAHKAVSDVVPVAFAFTQEAQFAKELANAAIEFGPQRLGAETPAVRSFQSLVGNLRARKMPDRLWPKLSEVMSDLPSVARYAWDRVSPADEEIAFFDVNVVMEQMPNPDSRVRLGGERDALGLPLAELDWRLTDFDRIMLLRALDATANAIGADGVGRMHIRIAEDGRDALEIMVQSHHPMGTTRMHDDPRKGVVDRNCRVHGMANLYIAGASVFTTGGSTSPTYNLVALAIRLADHMKAVLS